MTEWTLDRICQLTTNPTMLNALHACRDGHPLNKLTAFPWRSAWFLAAQQPSYIMPSDAIEWLKKQADREAKADQYAENRFWIAEALHQ